ncbi:MAG: hypothetical protein JSS66_06750 [Armatimonadetes bacterium]|nr:hypothetical protein [Armatimonadota bacterium]
MYVPFDQYAANCDGKDWEDRYRHIDAAYEAKKRYLDNPSTELREQIADCAVLSGRPDVWECVLGDMEPPIPELCHAIKRKKLWVMVVSQALGARKEGLEMGTIHPAVVSMLTMLAETYGGKQIWKDVFGALDWKGLEMPVDTMFDKVKEDLK